MSRKQDNRYAARPRALTASFGSSPLLGSQYNPYSSSYSNSYSPKSFRNYNPYSSGFGRSTSNLGIYGGTSSGYGGVYLNGPARFLSSLNLISPVLKNLDKKLLASQKNFKPKEIVPARVKEKSPDIPPVRPERKSRSMSRSQSFNKERSRSLTSLDAAGSLSSRSLSLNSLSSDGYGSASERTDVEPTTNAANAVSESTEKDYKALYEASAAEVLRLRELLNTSEQHLRDARSTISRLTRMSQSSLSEVEKREKRAMERKLSEMEEELKQFQKTKAENERLRAENRALTRVVSKLTNSGTK